MMVVLPQPDGPQMQVKFPSSMLKDRSSRIFVSPKLTLTWSTRMMAGVAAA